MMILKLRHTIYCIYIMKCPYCAHPGSRVTDKRKSPEGTRRRRECKKCKKRFTTHEKVVKLEMCVLKKDGSREKFQRDKLEKGVKKAFEKRQVDEESIDKMIDIIERQLMKRGKKDVKSSVIGELVVKKIKKLDNVAYIRFASVYKDFNDIKDFHTVLKEV